MTIDNFFLTKGHEHRSILQQVDQLIRDSHPGIELKKKYGLPMYVLKKNLVYLDIQKGKPLMGVVYGIHLVEIHPLLDFTGRKQIGHFSLEQMNEKRFADLLTILASTVDFDLRKKTK